MIICILVWFLLLGANVASAAAAVVITDAVDEGIDCFKVSTETATYYYDKAGAGFTSVLDRDGTDWVGFHPKGTPGIETGSAGWARGIPNMGFRAFGHPGYTGATSTTPDEKGTPLDKVTINSTKGAWDVRWEFFPSHAAMTVHAAPQNYWLLYEGTPGGALDPDDACRTPNSDGDLCAAPWEGDIAGTEHPEVVTEWVYFSEPKLNRSLFLIHNDDDETDLYFAKNEMTVFGFGRQRPSIWARALARLGVRWEDRILLAETPAVLIIGFVESTDFETVETHIDRIVSSGAANRSLGDDGREG